MFRIHDKTLNKSTAFYLIESVYIVILGQLKRVECRETYDVLVRDVYTRYPRHWRIFLIRQQNMCVPYAIWLAEYKIYCFNSWKVCAISDCCSLPTVFPLFLFITPRARAIPFIIMISIYLSASAYCINCRKSKIPLMRWTCVLVSVNVTCTPKSRDRERERVLNWTAAWSTHSYVKSSTEFSVRQMASECEIMGSRFVHCVRAPFNEYILN